MPPKKEVPVFVPPPPKKEPQKRFDYKQLVIANHVSAENKEKAMDELGKEGFEFVLKEGETYFFKRLYK